MIFLGDMHCPWMHRPTFSWALRIIGAIAARNEKIFIIQLGDIYDLYSFSKFSQRLSMTPKDELKVGRAQAEEMFRLIKTAAPNAEIHLIRGNHDLRAALRIWEHFGSSLDLLNGALDSLWSFPGVNTTYSTKDVLNIQGVNITHGHLSRLGAHLEALNYQNVVTGHSHRGGVYFHRMGDGRIVWELNAGYIGDPFSQELNYRPLNKYFKWTHGLGFVDAHGPRFIPYPGGDL